MHGNIRAVDWPRLQPVRLLLLLFPATVPLSARLPEMSFNFILRHWQFTKLQTQSLIAGQQLEIVLATDTDTETNSDTGTDTDTTCIAADTTATTFHCRPVESSMYNFMGAMWPPLGPRRTPSGARACFTPFSHLLPPGSCPASLLHRYVVSDEPTRVLRLLTARKNYFYLQVAMQERLGATEIEAEGERQEDCWL